MYRICIVDPVWTRYRLPVFQELSQHCKVDWIFSPSRAFGAVTGPEAPGLRYIEVAMLRPFGERHGMFQCGLAKYIMREKPDAIKMFANPRYLSFWTTLFAARVCGVPFYAHGVGFFKRHRIGFARRLMMKVMLRLATSYIAYAPVVRESLAAQGFCVDKVSLIPNSLTNSFPVPPEEKTGIERGILFVGRLRRGSGVSLLLRVMKRLKEEGGFPFTLHVVGDGEESEELVREAGSPWVTWHGAASDEELSDISRQCLFGCYPGSAGLSVVHMMSLSLPVVTHGDLSSHEGPEPSYITNGVTGMLYDNSEPEQSLYLALRAIAAGPDQVAKLQRPAFEEYQRLTRPSYAERLWSIFSEGNVPSGKALPAVDSQS